MTKNVLVSFLEKFDEYPFAVRINGKEYLIGSGEPMFTVIFHKDIPLSALTTSTSLALGEAYMDGDLEIEGDLYFALDHFLGQMGKFSTDESLLKKIMYSSTAKKNQKKEVRSHYDIGNDFYKLWLDETLSYSCGYFLHDDDTLYQAQVNKIDYILKKLCLKEGMTLLDIGCGWGYLLIEAAKKYGVHGTGITLSKEQYKEFQRRIEMEHLEGLVKAEILDYRDLPKSRYQFDRIVSVGMVEHVGRENYPLFMKCVKNVLKPGGVFLLHFISGLKEHAGDPWIKKYIFPGGTVPSLREKNFKEHIDEVREMFDERFVRMWDLYLCACAATFHNVLICIRLFLQMELITICLCGGGIKGRNKAAPICHIRI